MYNAEGEIAGRRTEQEPAVLTAEQIADFLQRVERRQEHYSDRKAVAASHERLREQRDALLEALKYYADEEIWDEEIEDPTPINGLLARHVEGPEAWTDRGEVARVAIAAIAAVEEKP